MTNIWAVRKPQHQPAIAAIAAEIKAQRVRLAISQEELAHRAGVDRSFVARLEVGATQPSTVVLFDLSVALGLEPATLVELIWIRLMRETLGT